MEAKKINLFDRTLIHSFLGCVVGLMLLHPLSTLIHDIIESNTLHFLSLNEILSSKHIIMAGYFTALGGVIGIFRGFYIHKSALLYEEIKHLSITDELTTLYNRRYFMKQLNKEIERARRYSHDLCLLVIDLNKFKQYNDTFGHTKGDKLLRELGVILKNSVRKPDFVARYGGDEFVVVMTESDKDDALELVKRLKHRISNARFNSQLSQHSEKVTASIGTATFPEDAKDMDKLFNIADSRLYKEKKRGRKMKINKSVRSLVFVGILAIVLTVVGFAINNTAHAGLSKKQLTEINDEGAVTVRATYMNPLSTPGEEVLAFEIRLNTHSVDLDAYKIDELSTLKDDKGSTYTPLGWFKPGGGGHHKFGVLKFAGTDKEGRSLIKKDTKFITLIIKDIDNVKERRFQWTFPLK